MTPTSNIAWKDLNLPLPRIALTVGEPAGIGPDICLQLINEEFEAELVVLSDPALMSERAERLGIRIEIKPWQATSSPHRHKPGTLRIYPISTAAPVICGQLNTDNASFVLEQIETAANGCLSGEFDAMVTAPAHKAIINQSGQHFSGHTEYLGRLCGTPETVMMLANQRLRVILVTTHLPLKDVSAQISADRLEKVLRITHADLKKRFKLTQVRLLVCGLNPHAGEEGEFGDEEILIIRPTIEKLIAEGMQITGPVPADTAFTTDSLQEIDAVVAMYHDQGLPVLKAQGFGETVNITLGLPIIRTSVDHGTALSLAGSGKASPDSLRHAIKQAIELADNNSRAAAA